MHEDYGLFCKTVIHWIIRQIHKQEKNTTRAKTAWRTGLLTMGQAQSVERSVGWKGGAGPGVAVTQPDRSTGERGVGRAALLVSEEQKQQHIHGDRKQEVAAAGLFPPDHARSRGKGARANGSRHEESRQGLEAAKLKEAAVN